jgi:hypothetical protein
MIAVEQPISSNDSRRSPVPTHPNSPSWPTSSKMLPPARPANGVDLIQPLPQATLDLANMSHHLLRQLFNAFALRVIHTNTSAAERRAAR